MRSHLRLHDEQRDKVICSVQGCAKKYADIKAWSVHFQNYHKEHMKRFNFFKEALGSEKIPNPTNVAEQSLVEKLKLENAQLKAQIRKILKIRCATKLRNRSIKQIK